MAQLYDIKLMLAPGQYFIGDPALIGATVLEVSKNGIHYDLCGISFSGAAREYSFKTTGLFAWKILFNSAVETADGGDLHIIYSI